MRARLSSRFGQENLWRREYARLRRMLVVETTNGRPPDPSEAETQTLWDTWKQRIEDRDEMSLQGKDYLAMHKETGIALRAIWSQTRRWTEYGKLPAAANGS